MAATTRLMQRHLGKPRRHTWQDWVFPAVLARALATISVAPIAVAVLLFLWINHHVVV
jgi:hypothetical protein